MGLGSVRAFTSKANMKTGTVFVLVAFMILGLEMAVAQRRPHGGKGAEGVRPESRGGSEPSFFPGMVWHRSRLQSGDWALIRPTFFNRQE